MTFGERVVALRKRTKWSQDKLAKLVGTSAPIIGRYERNEIKPSIEMAKKIADALNVTVDYLIGGTETMVFDKHMLNRLEAIENLSEEDKNRVYYFIDLAIRDAQTKKTYAPKSA